MKIKKIFLMVSLGLVISNYLYSQDIITSYVINTAGQLNISGNYQLLNNTGESVIEIKSDGHIVYTGYINTLDTILPTSEISYPTAESKLDSLTVVSGTASDDFSGVGGVEISIRRDSDTNYWNGSNWSNVEVWVTTTGTENWMYNLPYSIFTDGTYLARSRATDRDGNIEVSGVGNSFVLDISPPTTPIVTDEGIFTNSLNRLSATWVSTDSVSGVIDNQYAIGTRRDGSIDNWYTGASLPLGRARHTAVTAVIGSSIWLYIIGGESNSTSVIGGLIDYYSGNVIRWDTFLSLPHGFSDHASVIVMGDIPSISLNVIGGGTKDCYSAGINSSDGTLTSWFQGASLPVSLSYHSASYWKRRIYVTGGYTGVSSSAVYIGEVTDAGNIDNWKVASYSLPEGIYGHSSSIVDGRLYVIGGYTTTFTNKVYYTTIQSDGDVGAWQTTTSLPETRTYHSSETIEDKIYVIGGVDNSGVNRPTVYFTTPRPDGTLNNWITTAPMPEGRRFGSAGVLNVGGKIKIYYTGGYYSGFEKQSTVYQCHVNESSRDIVDWTSTGTTQNVTRTGLTLIEGQTYFFSVKTKNGAGRFSKVGYSDGITVDTGTAPQITNLTALPSTFNPSYGETTRLGYTISEPAFVTVTVAGRTLVDGELRKAGPNGELWNGRDATGNIPSETSTYTVTARDMAGNISTVQGTVTVASIPVISNVSNTPDPFAPNIGETTTISYKVWTNTTITIDIFDSSGVLGNGILVRKVVNNLAKVFGTYQEIWDGRDTNGNIVPYGIYRYEISGYRTDDTTIVANPQNGTITVYPKNPFEMIVDEVGILSTFLFQGNIIKNPPLSDAVSFALRSAQDAGQFLVSPIYEITGGPFVPDVILSFSYDSLLLGENLAIFKFNTQTNVFDILLPNQIVDIANNRIISEVGSFWGSLFAIFKFSDKIPPTISEFKTIPEIFSPNGDGKLDSTTISYVLSDNIGKLLTVTVKIYSQTNNLVKTLISDQLQKLGEQKIEWDGKDNSGVILPDELYTVKINAQDISGNKAIEQFATVTIDNTKPNVVFLSPSKENTGISKYITGNVKLIGTVKDNVAVDYYLVEYGVGNNPQSWVIIQDKTYKEVIENVLATWDTSNLQTGVYTLRLTGVDKVGNTASDVVTVNVGSPNSLLSIRDKFNHPDGISLDSIGYIYIADRNNDVVKKIDLSGRFIEIGKKELNKPEGVFIDKSDNIYIADRNGNEIRVYNSSLQPVKVLGGGILNKAVGVVVDNAGNIYVADRNNDRIVRFNTDESISIIGEGILNKPEGIFLDKGNIYVADRNNDCIREFSNAGNLIETICKGGLCKPTSVYVCANGDILVSDTNNDRVVRFDKYRNIVFSLKTWDSPPSSGTVSGFNKPKGITIDRLGNLYVSDSNNSLIEIFGESLPNVPSLELLAKNNDDNSSKETHKLKNDNVHANAKAKNNEEKKPSEEIKEQRKKLHEDIERRREELGKDIKESRKKNKEEWEKFREEAKQTKKELEEGLRANRKEIEKGFTKLNNNTNSNSIISNNNNGNHTNPVIIIKVVDAVTGEVLWKEGMDPLILHQGVLIGKKPESKEGDKDKDKSGDEDKGKQGQDNKKPEESKDKDKDKKPDEPGKGNSGGQGNQGNNGQGQGNGQGGNNQGNNGNGGNNNNNQGNNGNNNNQDKGKGKK